MCGNKSLKIVYSRAKLSRTLPINKTGWCCGFWDFERSLDLREMRAQEIFACAFWLCGAVSYGLLSFQGRELTVHTYDWLFSKLNSAPWLPTWVGRPQWKSFSKIWYHKVALLFWANLKTKTINCCSPWPELVICFEFAPSQVCQMIKRIWTLKYVRLP